MQPEINVDDLIIIKRFDNYDKKDIVTYKTDKSLITHRISRIEEGKIYTKGDNNNTEDEPIIKEQIQGKVVKTYKGLGKLIDYKTMSTLMIIFITIIFIIIILKK